MSLTLPHVEMLTGSIAGGLKYGGDGDEEGGGECGG